MGTVKKKQKHDNKPVRVNSEISFQKQSIVSKTVLRKRTGTVTLFAFDTGQRLSTHTAPFDALVLITDGEAEFTLARKKHTVKKGEMLLLPANIPHAVNASRRFRMILTMIRS